MVTSGPQRHAPKQECHNAKLCPLVVRERIINPLGAGDSRSAIASSPFHAILFPASQNRNGTRWNSVNRASLLKLNVLLPKLGIASNQKLDSQDDIPLNVLVPIACVSVDKLIALRSDLSVVARIEQVPSGKIFRTYEDWVKAIQARAKAGVDQPPTAQLGLPTVKQFRIPRRGDQSRAEKGNG